MKFLMIDLNIFYFIYMKRDWAEHRCYVKALSWKVLDDSLMCKVKYNSLKFLFFHVSFFMRRKESGKWFFLHDQYNIFFRSNLYDQSMTWCYICWAHKPHMAININMPKPFVLTNKISLNQPINMHHTEFTARLHSILDVRVVLEILLC